MSGKEKRNTTTVPTAQMQTQTILKIYARNDIYISIFIGQPKQAVTLNFAVAHCNVLMIVALGCFFFLFVLFLAIRISHSFVLTYDNSPFVVVNFILKWKVLPRNNKGITTTTNRLFIMTWHLFLIFNKHLTCHQNKTHRIVLPYWCFCRNIGANVYCVRSQFQMTQSERYSFDKHKRHSHFETIATF